MGIEWRRSSAGAEGEGDGPSDCGRFRVKGGARDCFSRLLRQGRCRLPAGFAVCPDGRTHVGAGMLGSVAPVPGGIANDTGGPDLADVRGMESAKRALEIAAAGSHHLLML